VFKLPMRSLRNAARAGLRRGLSSPYEPEKKKKKRKPKQLSQAELRRLREVLAKQKASEALY